MPSEQLVLDFARRPALGRQDFFVSPANEMALAQLDAWRIWPAPRLALIGASGVGKSHLARVWAADSGADIIGYADLVAFEAQGFDAARPLVVEDADQIATTRNIGQSERALFHVYNALAEIGTPLVLTGQEAPARWKIELPDLASRLSTVPLARIDPPDSTLLEVLLVKFFADRQVHVSPDVIAFLLQRIERNVASAEQVVAGIDNAALQARRAITRPFAAEVLKEMEQRRATS